MAEDAKIRAESLGYHRPPAADTPQSPAPMPEPEAPQRSTTESMAAEEPPDNPWHHEYARHLGHTRPPKLPDDLKAKLGDDRFDIQLNQAGLSLIRKYDTAVPDVRAQRVGTAMPDPKRFTVEVHGSPTGVKFGGHDLSAKELAEVIRASPGYKQGEPIRLLSCRTGSDTPDGSPNFAEQLSKELGVEVLAPKTDAWVDNYGNMYASGDRASFDVDSSGAPQPHFDDPGQWVSHSPDGTKAVHDSPFPPGHDPQWVKHGAQAQDAVRRGIPPDHPQAPKEFQHPGGPRFSGFHSRKDAYGTDIPGHISPTGDFVPHAHIDAYGRWHPHGQVDAQGRWVPGHVEPNGRLVPNGHFDDRGRWIAHGRTDDAGRWVPVHFDGNQYHDLGRFHPQTNRWEWFNPPAPPGNTPAATPGNAPGAAPGNAPAAPGTSSAPAGNAQAGPGASPAPPGHTPAAPSRPNQPTGTPAPNAAPPRAAAPAVGPHSNTRPPGDTPPSTQPPRSQAPPEPGWQTAGAPPRAPQTPQPPAVPPAREPAPKPADAQPAPSSPQAPAPPRTQPHPGDSPTGRQPVDPRVPRPSPAASPDAAPVGRPVEEPPAVRRFTDAAGHEAPAQDAKVGVSGTKPDRDGAVDAQPLSPKDANLDATEHAPGGPQRVDRDGETDAPSGSDAERGTEDAADQSRAVQDADTDGPDGVRDTSAGDAPDRLDDGSHSDATTTAEPERRTLLERLGDVDAEEIEAERLRELAKAEEVAGADGAVPRGEGELSRVATAEDAAAFERLCTARPDLFVPAAPDELVRARVAHPDRLRGVSDEEISALLTYTYDHGSCYALNKSMREGTPDREEMEPYRRLLTSALNKIRANDEAMGVPATQLVERKISVSPESMAGFREKYGNSGATVREEAFMSGTEVESRHVPDGHREGEDYLVTMQVWNGTNVNIASLSRLPGEGEVLRIGDGEFRVARYEENGLKVNVVLEEVGQAAAPGISPAAAVPTADHGTSTAPRRSSKIEQLLG
ncbi:hypothetical protein N599_12945 [Saccharopolyspora erythraea D]|nr:ADP-ribosyltransferase domain-containing protein [Saccharopolyspora erythraea]EQD85857.1 hypothetical protein N599_12945 [Saccharopolyspora erythraea D]